MKAFVKICLLCLIPVFSTAQFDPNWGHLTTKQADSLKRSLLTEKNDTLKMAAYNSLGNYYQNNVYDSGLYYYEQQLVLSKKIKMKLWEADAYGEAGWSLLLLDNLMKSYEYHTEAMKLANDEKNEADNWRPWVFSNSKNSHEARISILGATYQTMGYVWGNLGYKEKRISYHREVLKLGQSINNGQLLYMGYSNFAGEAGGPNRPFDSVNFYTNKALKTAEASGFKRTGGAFMRLAGNYLNRKMMDSAFFYVHKSIATNKAENYLRFLTGDYAALSTIFGIINKDSCLYYAEKALETARISGQATLLLEAYRAYSNADKLCLIKPGEVKCKV